MQSNKVELKETKVKVRERNSNKIKHGYESTQLAERFHMYCICNENVQLARTYLPRALSLIQDRKDVFLLTRIALPRLVMRLLHRWKIDCFIDY